MSKNNKKWRNAGLYTLLVIVVIALTTAFLDKKPQGKESWRYDEFINRVESNAVSTVQLSADRSKAIATDANGDRIVVNLPDDPQLIDILADNHVDISVLPQNDDGFWFRALSPPLSQHQE